MALMLAADRVLMLRRFFFKFTDPDQSLLWYSAREYAEGRLREPSFPAQTYLSSGEALLAAPLLLAGVQPYHALPITSVLLVTIPWVLLILAAWMRRAWLAVLLIAALPLMLPNEFLMLSGIPHGLTPGIFVATVATFLGLTGTGKPAGSFLVGLLAGLAFGLNQTSALLTVPLLVYLAFREQTSRVWLIAGLTIGGSYLLLSQYFYLTHPGYRFHPDPPFAYSTEHLINGVLHIGRYLNHLGFWFLKAPIVAIVGLAIPAAVLIRSGHPSHVLAGVTAVALPLASLGLQKAADGTSSVFFSYTRLYIVLPLLWALLIVLADRDFSSGWSERGVVAAALSITGLAAASFLGRSLVMEGDINHAVAVNDAFPIIAADRLPTVLEECRMVSEIVDSRSVRLVVYDFNSSPPYACGALGYNHFETLNPGYERRTWRLFEERRTARTRMLIVGAGDARCSKGERHLSRCEPVPGTKPLVLHAKFPKQSVTELLPRIGIPVRNF